MTDGTEKTNKQTNKLVDMYIICDEWAEKIKARRRRILIISYTV